MHTKTMEGLSGASMNMKLLNTPFRVYKDAEPLDEISYKVFHFSSMNDNSFWGVEYLPNDNAFAGQWWIHR